MENNFETLEDVFQKFMGEYFNLVTLFAHLVPNFLELFQKTSLELVPFGFLRS